MAVYKLIPSSLTGSNVTDPSNAYTDTDSDTSAKVNGSATCYLGGFDFSVIPSNMVVKSIQVKVKAMHRSRSGNSTAVLVSNGASDANELSDTVTFPAPSSGGYEAYVRTFTISATVSEIMQYADTICIRLATTQAMYIYGAEVIVEASSPVPNKIIYGNETLIDLTSDTATASDVAVGKIFHLASGVQATGTFVASLSKATATTSDSTGRTVSFTVSKEPSWFMMICVSANDRAVRVMHMLYNGSATTIWYPNQTSVGSIISSTTYGSFSYSNGKLKINVISTYIGAADWELYYL